MFGTQDTRGGEESSHSFPTAQTMTHPGHGWGTQDTGVACDYPSSVFPSFLFNGHHQSQIPAHNYPVMDVGGAAEGVCVCRFNGHFPTAQTSSTLLWEQVKMIMQMDGPLYDIMSALGM